MRIHNAQFYKTSNHMKNFIQQFIPRDPEQWESFFGMLCGIAILSIVFYFYSI